MRLASKGVLLFAVILAFSLPAFAQTTTTPAPGAPPQPADVQKKPAPAGPAQIKVGDNVNIRFGVLIQPQLDLSENATPADTTAENFLIRRMRFIVSGQVAKNAYFFFQTENARLGASSATGTPGNKTLGGFQTIDADIEYRFSKPFNLQAGLIYLPTSREALKSSASQFMIDQNTYAYTATGALAGTGGRDTGFMARGYFLADKLEYRVGLFQGARTGASSTHPAGSNSFRQIARLQYEVFDTEPYAFPSYAGGYFGTKKVLALGAAWDKQGDYKGPTADIYADFPTAFGSAQGTASYMRLNANGAPFIASSFGNSNIFVVDGGAYMKGVKLGPWARWEQRNFTAGPSPDEKRWLVGLNWYPMLNNFNLKLAYGQFHPDGGRNLKQVIAQMQFFYF